MLVQGYVPAITITIVVVTIVITIKLKRWQLLMSVELKTLYKKPLKYTFFTTFFIIYYNHYKNQL